MNPRDANPDALARPQAAQAELAFARDAGGATFLARQRVGYPFHVGRTLSLPGDPAGMPTVYLQSCAGGIFEGDDLRLLIEAGEGTRAHVTTGAATVVHSTQTLPATQQVEIEAHAGSFLEYLPDPAILFPRARLATGMRVRRHAEATVILADAILLHDPQGTGECFDWLQCDTVIEDESGRLLARDRFRITGQQLARRLAGITGTWKVQGSLFVVAAGDAASRIVPAVRAALQIDGVYGGASMLPNQSGAWTRMLAVDAAALKAAMFAAWAAAREILAGAAPQPRRK